MTIAATVVQFKRTKDSEWESGLAILSEAGTSDIIALVSEDGKLVTRETIWDYHSRDWLGTILLPKEETL